MCPTTQFHVVQLYKAGIRDNFLKSIHPRCSYPVPSFSPFLAFCRGRLCSAQARSSGKQGTHDTLNWTRTISQFCRDSSNIALSVCRPTATLPKNDPKKKKRSTEQLVVVSLSGDSTQKRSRLVSLSSSTSSIVEPNDPTIHVAITDYFA